MGTTDELEPVDLVELGRDLGTEEVASTTWAHGPRLDILRIRPHEVTESAFVGHFLLALDRTDLIKRPDLRGQTTVHTEHTSVDHRRQVEVVEHVRAVLPRVGVAVLAHALFVKAIDLRDLATLVVPTKQRDAVWVARLETEQVLERLDTVVASIHKVTLHEDVVGRGHFAAASEKLEQVEELAVDVAADRHGAAHGLHVGLFNEDLLDDLADLLELELAEQLAGAQMLEPLGGAAAGGRDRVGRTHLSSLAGCPPPCVTVPHTGWV